MPLDKNEIVAKTKELISICNELVRIKQCRAYRTGTASLGIRLNILTNELWPQKRFNRINQPYRQKDFPRDMQLGAIFRDDYPYRIERIIRRLEIWKARANEFSLTKSDEVDREEETFILVKPGKADTAKQAFKENIFHKEGNFWTVKFQGKIERITHCVGFSYVSFLISKQGRTFKTTEFLSLYHKKPITLASGDNQLDDEAKEHYKKALDDIEFQLEEAKKNKDSGKQQKLEEDKAFLIAELAKAAGYSNHKKKLNSEFDKHRLSIGKAIVRSIKKIDAYLPELAEHLRDSIPSPYSGTSLSYRPAKLIDWLL